MLQLGTHPNVAVFQLETDEGLHGTFLNSRLDFLQRFAR